MKLNCFESFDKCLVYLEKWCDYSGIKLRKVFGKFHVKEKGFGSFFSRKKQHGKDWEKNRKK